jgi:hypothetical protein
MKKAEHPIQLPDSLINKWLEDTDTSLSVQFQEAAEWGANAELEACCAWFIQDGWNSSHPTNLRATRRPKPPSLKEQALAQLDHLQERAFKRNFTGFQTDIIYRALKELPE